MSDLLLKKEFLAKRCEICHQSDAFEPTTEECSRCKGLFSFEGKANTGNELIKAEPTSAFQEMLKERLAANPTTKTSFLTHPIFTKISKCFDLEYIDPCKEENLVPLIKADYKYHLKRYLVFMLIPLVILSVASFFSPAILFGIVFFSIIFFLEIVFISIKWHLMIKKSTKTHPINTLVTLREELDSDGDSAFYLALNQTNQTIYSAVDELRVIKPTWYYKPIINSPITARVFRFSRKKAIIHTNFGILVSF